MTTQERLEQAIHGTGPMRLSEQVKLVFLLSLPAIMSNLVDIVMSYIDASMVGSLGAHASASIGLVSTSMWLFGGLCAAIASGFSVQVAHLFGAGDKEKANDVVRQAFIAALVIGLVIGGIALSISAKLPIWLGGGEDIIDDSRRYFQLFAIALPIHIITFLMSSMLRCSGNMKFPSMVYILVCILDVVFNFFLIFPTRQVGIGSLAFTCPGMGLGVLGAAWGTLLAWLTGTLILFYYISFRSKELRLSFRGRCRPERRMLKKAWKIGSPIGMERVISCAAQITSTMIVAPLGTVAIAANAFGITIESLCYMPGYGIGDAATTLVGQSIGAQRPDLIRRFSVIALALGVGAMSLLAIVMYIFAPELMTLMTPDLGVRQLTTDVLRIEAWAEPLFATSIVCYSIFVGMGKTLNPSFIQLGSIWLVRIPLAAALAGTMGLKGVWIAMAIELCVRGIVMLIRLIYKLRNGNKQDNNKTN